MNIAASYAARIIKECAWADCRNVIEKGSRIFRGRNTRGQGAWTVLLYWHFDCYGEQAAQYLDAHPYVAKVRGTAGRTKLKLDVEGRMKRRSLICRASQLRKSLLEAQGSSSLLLRKMEISRAQILYDRVRDQLDVYGGVPSTWIKKGW